MWFAAGSRTVFDPPLRMPRLAATHPGKGSYSLLGGPMDSEHAERIAENEARYRAANERADAAITEFLGHVPDTFDVMCECPVTQCRDMINVRHGEYARVRRHPTHFIVMPEHVIAGAEVIVGDHDNYWVIEKIGIGGHVAHADAAVDRDHRDASTSD